ASSPSSGPVAPTAAGPPPAILRPARPTASAGIASAPTTPTTPPMASAAAASACARPNRPVPADAGEEATQMWRDRDPYREQQQQQHVPDNFWWVVAALLFAACGLVWLIGQVAAILFGAHQHLPVRLVDMLGVLLRLPG